MKNQLHSMFLALALLAGLAQTQTARATVTFSVTPAAVSSTFTGTVTLQIGGLAAGETVTIQKYLDANSNSVIDASDWLVQQFNLTDGKAGMAFGGVTNFNVPGDMDTTAGQITAKLNFQNGDIAQAIVAQYIFKLSSPTGSFSPITKLFNVTNFPYAQKFTGSVISNNTGTTLSDAVVLLFPPSSGNGGGGPVAGALANSAGLYTIRAPAGTYSLVAIRSNYVADMQEANNLVLAAGATVTNNVDLHSTTFTISGKLIDTNTLAGLAGVLIPVEAGGNNSKSLLAIGFTDTNGKFTVGVTSNMWGVDNDSSALAVLGYVGLQNKTNVDTTAGSVAGVTIALPKATALIYGSVKDNLGNPFPGLDVSAYDSSNMYDADAYTDANGNYVLGVLGLGTNDFWNVQANGKDALIDYVFSQQNENTNIDAGHAVLENITALLATNFIIGTLTDSSNNPIAHVGVNGNLPTTNGLNYQTHADTDSNGNYSMTVAPGTWYISVNCQGGDDSLDNALGSGNYACPNLQSVTVSANNATNNIIVQLCGGISITTTSLPVGEVNVPYDQFLQASSCAGNYSWSLISGSLPSNLNWNASGEINGMPTDASSNSFTFKVTDGNGLSTNQALSLTIYAQLQVTNTSLPNATIGAFYSQTLQASGGLAPYTWSLSPGSSNLPPGLGLTNGVISGIPATNGGPFDFSVRVTDNLGGAFNQPLSLTIAPPPLQILTTSLPAALENIPYNNALSASGGQPPYTWTSTNLPAGLTLTTNGVISGTLTNIGTNFFTVRVTDALAGITNQLLSLTVLLAQGSLQVTLQPAGAVTNGAEWQVDGGVWNASGAVASGLSLGTNHILAFKVISGWSTPSNQMVAITNGMTTTNTGVYTLQKVKDVTLTITSPKPAQRLSLTTNVFTVTGTARETLPAKDNVTVEAVYYKFNGGSWTLATPGNNFWSNWTASVTLLDNTNDTISAYAVDTASNASATTKVTFQYVPSAILTVSTNGFGGITPVDNGKLLAIGTNYTLTATASHNHLFSNWVASGSETFVSNNPILKFKMQAGLSLTANFVTNVFLAAQGTPYTGLFAPTNAPRQQTNSGAITFTVTSAGVVSGKLTIGSNTPSLTGHFNPAGAATIITPRKGLTTLTTTLQLDFTNQTATGSVTDTDFVAEVTTDLQQKATHYDGQYTLILPGTTNPVTGPFGTSYGTVTVKSGAITFGGSLADGTGANQTSFVSKDGYWPFYLPLYNGNGSLWSWNCFTNTNGAKFLFSTNASWINATNSTKTALYRAGFTNDAAEIVGSAYNPTNKPLLDLTNGHIILEGGNLPSITNSFTLTSKNTITLTNAADTNKLTLTIKPGGVISGSFANPSNSKQTINVNGVLLQNETNAQGYFLGTNQSGTFKLMSP